MGEVGISPGAENTSLTRDPEGEAGACLMIWEEVFQPPKQREEQGQRPGREGKLCGPRYTRAGGYSGGNTGTVSSLCFFYLGEIATDPASSAW